MVKKRVYKRFLVLLKNKFTQTIFEQKISAYNKTDLEKNLKDNYFHNEILKIKLI